MASGPQSLFMGRLLPQIMEPLMTMKRMGIVKSRIGAKATRHLFFGLSLSVLGIGAMGWAAIPGAERQISSPEINVSAKSEGERLPNPLSRAPKVIKRFGGLALSFEENQGQVDEQVMYLARGKGYTLFLTGTEAVLTLRQARKSKEENTGKSQLPKLQVGDVKVKAAPKGGGTVDNTLSPTAPHSGTPSSHSTISSKNRLSPRLRAEALQRLKRGSRDP